MTRLNVVFRALAVLALAGASAVAGAQPSDSDDVRQLTARVSFLDGRVSYARGDDPDDWQPADFNAPLTIGDRLYTDERSRAELQVHGGFYVRLGDRADLEILNLTYDAKQFSVRSGSAAFALRRLGDDETFEVDTPNAAVTFERRGDYRVDVDGEGNTRVLVRRGRALVTAGGGQVPVNAGDEMDVEGLDSPRYDVVALAEPDGFDRWIGERERRLERGRAREYVHADIVGADDLDEYGRWQRHPQYGWVWAPASVEAEWAPYRAGHWVWQDPWGWTWVAAERWGWAPYHYGRWVRWSSRWWWVPVAPAVRVVRYAPALVAFCGGGPGWTPSLAISAGGYIGWFPLAPRDPFFHWWGPRVAVASTRVTYVNQTYITVINHNTFVSGGVVTTNWVHDRNVVNSVMRAPVMRGPLPVVPTQGALHVAVRPNLPPPMRPPQAVVARPVVARIAPPPPPPAFDAKVTVIRQNRGAPVAATTATRIVEADKSAARPVVAVRPAMAPGNMTLTPKKADARVPKAEPAVPVRGRAPAAAATPAPGAGTSTAPPERGRQPDYNKQPTRPPGQAGPAPTAAPPEGGRRRDVVQRPTPSSPQGQGQPTRHPSRGGPPPTAAAPERGQPQVERRPTRPPSQGGPPPTAAAPERGQPQYERRPTRPPSQGNPPPTAPAERGRRPEAEKRPPAEQPKAAPARPQPTPQKEKATREKPKEKPKVKPTPTKD
jgi:hypothetical protein